VVCLCTKRVLILGLYGKRQEYVDAVHTSIQLCYAFAFCRVGEDFKLYSGRLLFSTYSRCTYPTNAVRVSYIRRYKIRCKTVWVLCNPLGNSNDKSSLGTYDMKHDVLLTNWVYCTYIVQLQGVPFLPRAEAFVIYHMYICRL
jgi:hypothetical protein